MSSPSDQSAETSDPEGIALELNDITKCFLSGGRKINALQHVSMRVRHGRVTGLIGPDGAGKTTLMRLAAGLLVPEAGKITVLGMDAARESLAVQAAIGYMPQRFGLYDELTVQENLDLYADLQGVGKKARPKRYQELMKMTGLAPFLSRMAGRLSGGMKQKLGLACTLVRSSRLLLLDEPTVGVDPLSRRELWAIVYRLVREEAMSVLLSTSYLNEAERCDKVLVLHEGQVLGHGPPGEFSKQMQGRTYAVMATGIKKRKLQKKLVGAAGVIDAVIQGYRVRLVMETRTPPEAERLLSGVDNVSIKPVPPRFEDNFIAMLRTGRTANGGGRTAETGRINRKNEAEHVIKVRGLQRRFGDFYAVKGVTFDVCRGEVFGLLGANGAGKSTTFRMLCGLLPPSAGNLKVAGMDLRRSAAEARARIGYMAQKFSLYGNLSVRQNLKFFSSVYGLSGKKRTMRIDWALEQFELNYQAEVISSDLPVGYKQRLAMACALMHEPDILFLDEPTSGVDPLARREFWQRINAQAEQGVTIMVTTHFMEEAEYCDRLAIMAAGEILAIGSPSEIRSRVRSPSRPEPTMEDAFISLIESGSQGEPAS